MKSRTVHEHDGMRTIVAILANGDEVRANLEQLAREERLNAAQVTAIGAFRSAVIRYFDWERKEYLPITVDEQVEVASLNGDIASGEDGNPVLHMHAVLGRRDGTALAGDLQEATVRPTLEVIVSESPDHLRRAYDPATRLPLIRLPD
jgi:predicted DNA-binding protein with PD1-like motif